MLDRFDPLGVRAILLAVALGLLIGGGAAFGWARVTPAAEGWFTCSSVLIGASFMKQWMRKGTGENERNDK